MNLIYFDEGNFGDDLNALVWPQVLSQEVRETPGIAALGIGSILNDSFVAPALAAGNKVFVLGSGAEYGKLPARLTDLHVMAVRGPLTAAVIGQPDKAVTDAAILLADIPEGRRGTGTGDVLFIPHFKTARDSRWRDAARKAGVTYVDPRWDTRRILDLIRDARLVVTEAMHGAIVADILRVPWVPLQISPLTPSFKWVDWTSSVDLPYEPQQVAPASVWERQRYARLARQQAAAGLPLPTMTADHDTLISEFRRRYKPAGAASAKPALAPPSTPAPPPGGPALRGLAKRGAAVGLAIVQRPLDRPLLDAAAERLARLKQHQGYLSDERVFEARRAMMRDAVARFERAALGR